MASLLEGFSDVNALNGEILNMELSQPTNNQQTLNIFVMEGNGWKPPK